MTINQRVKEVRKTLNLSQAKFANAISISNGYIAGIELENRKVNNRLVKLICAVFDVNENWLNTGQGDMFNKTSDKNLKRINNIFNELNPEYQEYILQQIEELLNLQNKNNTKS